MISNTGIGVGDFVKVRSWVEMAQAESATVTSSGDIFFSNQFLAFLESMKPLCGKTFRVADVYQSGEGFFYHLDLSVEFGSLGFCDEMLTAVELQFNPDEYPIDELYD